MIKPKVKKLLRARDQWCWHCGSDSDLVVHHRKNRGSGGSKNPEINDIQNLMLVCWQWNGLIEAHYQSAEAARLWGHKIAQWQQYDVPVFDRYALTWYVLDKEGNKGEVIVDEGRAVRLLLPDLFERGV